MRTAGRRGYTMIEVVAVMVMISVLVVVAYTTLRSVKNSVSDIETQQQLLHLGGGQTLHFANRGDFASASPNADALERIEDDFDYTVGGLPVTTPNRISVVVDDIVVGGETIRIVGMAALGPSGDCYTLRVADPTSSVPESMGTWEWDATDPLSRECSGAEAVTVVGQDW